MSQNRTPAVMARPLAEFFGRVLASDIHPHGFGEVRNFLAGSAA